MTFNISLYYCPALDFTVRDSVRATVAQEKTMIDQTNSSVWDKRIKIGLTLLIFSAIALQLWNAIAPVPPFLQSAIPITLTVLLIHVVEGLIAAFLIFRYRQRLKNNPQSQPSTLLTEKLPDNTLLAVVKGALYVFFIGAPAFSEVMKAAKPSPESAQ